MIKLSNLSKGYGERVLFQQLDYSFEEGYFYALSGKSGSGKSSLLNCIGKLDEDYDGDIEFRGTDIADVPATQYFKEVTGYLFQNYALIENKDVAFNLSIVLTDHSKKQDIEKKKVLEKVGLDESYLNRKVYTLSGGEAQRVALSRLYLKNSPVILADEPTGALDQENGENIIFHLKEMAKNGKVVIAATHDNVVLQAADAILEISTYRS